MDIEILNKITFTEFKNQLKIYEDKLKNVATVKDLNNLIVSDFNQLKNMYVTIGNLHKKNDFFEIEEQDAIEKYLINYVLPEDFKNMALLFRDVYLELYKANIYLNENKILNTSFTNHFETSKSMLLDVVSDFQKSISQQKNLLFKDSKSIKKVKLKLTLYKNPWDIYVSQFEVISSQINEIENQKAVVLNYIETFKELRNSVEEVVSNYKNLVEKITKNNTSIIKNIEDNINFKELLSHLDEKLLHQLGFDQKHLTFSETINFHISLLKKIEIPVKTENGFLFKREVDLKKRTQKWFDYQVLPEFMDLLGFETSLVSKYNLNLINIKNSLQLSKEKNEEPKFKSIINSILQLQVSLKELELKGETISNSLRNKISNQLLISNLINEKPFLDVTLNSSLNIESNSFFKKIKEKLKKGNLYFNLQYKKSKNYESLTNLEISTQCIAHRMFQDESSQYDSLFLNRKFIGDLFLVPRKFQEKKIERIVNQWSKGLHKSVLITGDRLSGRSTFLDYSAKKFFGHHIVTLTPNSSAVIDGRKFKTTNDLKEALLYVKNNNSKSTKPLILIDDLELWRDKNHSLLYNIKALINFIETESNNAFVMTTTTNMMVNHLNKQLNFSATFSHEINLDIAEKEEITKAILLRHGATHCDLVSEKLEIIPDSKLPILAHKICKLNDFNFGQSLQSWTHCTFLHDANKVLFKETYFEFLDFFTSQEIIILKQTLIFMYISEFSIKNLTTTAFEAEFKSALRRLMNVKVLLRDINGNLYVNPVVVNDVARIVNNKIAV